MFEQCLAAQHEFAITDPLADQQALIGSLPTNLHACMVQCVQVLLSSVMELQESV